MSVIWTLFDDHAFRLANISTGQLERAVNRAVFDAQSVAIAAANHEQVVDLAQELRPKLGSLLVDADFHDASTRATGDRARTLLRINMIAGALEESGVSLDRNLLPEE